MGTVTHDETAEQALAAPPRPAPLRLDRPRAVGERAKPYAFPDAEATAAGAPRRVVVLDLGVKYNILRSLRRWAATPRPCPARRQQRRTSWRCIPMASCSRPAPATRRRSTTPSRTAAGLVGKTPIMGICLGHQVLGPRLRRPAPTSSSSGIAAPTTPCATRRTGRVHITAQNHGYAVDDAGLAQPTSRSAIVNVNDGTVEGLRHRREPVMTIQYHSEASPGSARQHVPLRALRRDDARCLRKRRPRRGQTKREREGVAMPAPACRPNRPTARRRSTMPRRSPPSSWRS